MAEYVENVLSSQLMLTANRLSRTFSNGMRVMQIPISGVRISEGRMEAPHRPSFRKYLGGWRHRQDFAETSISRWCLPSELDSDVISEEPCVLAYAIHNLLDIFFKALF
eukprot:IDg20349t1